jgi:hypothetical protein
MEDVPRQALVNMRVDSGLKKLVLQHDGKRGRFKWTAQHAGSRKGGPRYASVFNADLEPEDDWGGGMVHSAMAAGFDAGFDGQGLKATRGRRGGRRESRRERSLLRAEDAIRPRENDADGVVATIPQFLALLHASRSIVEAASAAAATMRTVETDDGESVRAVSLKEVPKGRRHTGRDVHVVVLVPEGAIWAEERIFWTDEADGLGELRQKKYRDVVDKGRMRARATTGGRRSNDRDWDLRSLRSLSPRSPPLSPQTAGW